MPISYWKVYKSLLLVQARAMIVMSFLIGSLNPANATRGKWCSNEMEQMSSRAISVLLSREIGPGIHAHCLTVLVRLANKYSPYDGKSWTDADDIQIDHMIPLANAWR